jgi:hypothetical protein
MSTRPASLRRCAARLPAGPGVHIPSGIPQLGRRSPARPGGRSWAARFMRPRRHSRISTEQFSHSPTRQGTGALFWGGCGDWCSGSTGHLSGRSWTASQSVSLTRLIGPGRGAGGLVDGWSRHLGVCREIQYGRTAMRVNRQQDTRVFLVLAVVLASLWTGGLAASSAANPADYLASSRAQLGIQPAALRNSAPALRPAAERPGPRGHLVPLLAALAAALAGACRWRAAAQRPGLACSGSRVCSTPLEARAPPHLQPA